MITLCKNVKEAFVFDRPEYAKLKFWSLILPFLLESRYQATVLLRLQQYFKWKQSKNKYKLAFYEYIVAIIQRLNFIFNSINVSSLADIGRGLWLNSSFGVVIGGNTIMGENVHLYKNVTLGTKGVGIDKYPTIGKNVHIYVGAVVLGGITIGDNSVIGANSVVIHDVPKNAVVAGVPARIIKSPRNKHRS